MAEIDWSSAPKIDWGSAPKAEPLSGNVQQSKPEPFNAMYGMTPRPQVFQPVPYTEPKDLGQFGKNFQTDTNNLLQGISVMGAGISARANEALPHDLLSGKAFQQGYPASKWNPLDENWLGSLPPIRMNPTQDNWLAGDPQSALNLAGAVVKSYKSDYIDPLKRGDLGAIGKKFLRQPLSTTLDLMPGFSKGVEIAKAAKVTPLGMKLTTAGEEFASKLAEKAAPWVSQTREAAEAHKALTESIVKFGNEFIDTVNNEYDLLKEAHDAIPKHLQDKVIMAGEMRDRALHTELSQVPEVQEFWRRADAINEKIAGKLIETGAMTQAEHDIAKYGPLARQMTGLDEKALSTPAGMKAIEQAKATGANPVYFGLITNRQVRGALKARGGLFTSGRGGKLPTGKPGFLEKRLKGNREEAHATNALDVTAARMTQALQFLHLRDFFKEVSTNPKLIKDGVEFNTREFFEKLGKTQGIPSKQIEQFMQAQKMPETISLPKAIAAKLEDLQKGVFSGDAGWLEKHLQKTVALQKTLGLGFNLGWAIWQQAQNAMIYGMAAFRGLDDIAASIMAFPLAKDPDIAKALPKHWLGDLSNDSVQVLEDGGMLAKAQAPFLAVANKVFGIASAGDNTFRNAFGVYNLLKEARKASPKGQALLSDAFKLQAQKASVLKILDNPQATMEASKEINKWFGRYDQLFNHEKRHLRTLIPYVNWWFHAWSIARSLPETPYKAALIARLAKEAPIQLQDTNILTKNELRSGGVVLDRLGPNGKPLVMYGNSAALPIATALEQLKWLLQMGQTTREEAPQLPLFHWFVGTGLNLLGLDTAGRDFTSPSLVKSKGKVWNKEGQKVESVTPDLPHIAMRNLMPSTESQIRQALAYPYKPSVMTSIMDPTNANVRKDFKTGRPELNFTVAEIMVQQLTKTQAHEQTVTKKDEIRMDKVDKKNFKKARKRQAKKLEPVANSIMRVFGEIKDAEETE